MFFELLIGLITVLLVWEYVSKRRINQIFKQNGIKSPTQVPILGAGHHFARETPETIFGMFERFKAKFGKTWYMWVFHECTITTSDARVIEAIFTSQKLIDKSKFYVLLKSWLGLGLLLSTGKKWHARRKIISPTFHFKILEQFVEVFDQQSGNMVQKLYDRADGKTVVNMFPVVCLTALDIIAETAMGVKVNAQVDPNFAYVKSVKAASEITARRFMNPIQRFETGMRWTAPLEYRKLHKHVDVMHAFTEKVISDRRMALEKSIADGTYKTISEDNDLGSKKRLALLDVLLQSTVAGNPLTNEDIREEVDTFMFEGHDTTTSGISFTLYLLSRHPEVQQKLFQEIRDVIGDDKEKPVAMRQLQDLKYMECVLKESMRLYPPVPIVGRYVPEDTMLSGILFPANTNIFVPIYIVLHDPDYFPEPELFKPQRFSADSAERIDPFAYVPFSAGPRNCIGQKFAMLEMKSTVSKILRHFELLPLGDEVRPTLNLVLRSESGVNLGLKPRIYK